jgi:diguanylate cyclase (GGDEF)-like protein
MDTRVLVVDDEPTIRTVIAQVLQENGYRVTEATSGEEALTKFRQEPYPIVMTDVVMGRMSGIQLLEEVRLLDTDTLVVIMTSQASLEMATSALRSGAYDFLIKPFDDLDIISVVVNRANEKVSLVRHNRSLLDSLRKNAEELERVNQSLKEMADHDGLTGMYNHRCLREALDREVSRVKRHGGCFSILFMDLDNFKQYNDTHGHLMGDELLRELAGVFRERARRYTVLGRYGGEEFVAVVPEASREDARCYAEDIRRRVEEHQFKGRETQPTGRVTLSVGVATFPEDGRDSTELLRRADRALYEAKQSGKNRVCG